MADLLDLYNRILDSFNSLSGKDKAFRSAFYLIQLLTALIDASNPLPKETTTLSHLSSSLKAIEPSLSAFRQGMRVGYVPIQWNAFLSVYNKASGENVLSLLNALKTFCMVPYYGYDNLCWLAKLKVINADSQQLYVLSQWWWLGNVVLSMVYDGIILIDKRNQLIALKKQRAETASEEERSALAIRIRALAVEMQILLIQFGKNASDAVLGLSAIKYNFSRLTNGIAGSASSLLGWYLIIPAAKK